MSIQDRRAEIDAIDSELLRLLNARARLALRVGETKKSAGLALCDSGREREVIERACRANEGPLNERSVARLFRSIIRESRLAEEHEMKGASATASAVVMSEAGTRLRVAFQGERGAFSETAAVQLLGPNVELVPRPTFESLFAAIEEGAADRVLAPVENSLAGSVHRSYDLLLESQLKIVGEVIIPIRHCLIGCPGATLENIKTVASHPVALAQCQRFFATHPQIRPLLAEDTAGSVAQVIKGGDLTCAAIAGRRTAEVYGGAILLEHLEDHAENYTRFVLLAPSAESSDDADKLSLAFKLPHRPAALYHALEPFARHRIDLIKIESRPIRGRPWEYHFSLDLHASIKDGGVREALAEIEEYAREVRLLGCYPSALSLATQG
ncbi:MAG TPA: prephenate dehydratase [Pyrinomonadaceae bacterium]|nr:prephenate dehydratase [Pyrinomonadaceae bacterium]